MTKINATENQASPQIRVIGWQEVREIMADKFNDREHWMMIVHGSAAHLLIEIEERYYSGDRNKDFTLITCVECGEVFGVIAARKRHMLAYQLVSLLRQVADAHISEREVLQRDVGIVAPDWSMDAAMELTTRLFTHDDLAIAP